VLLLSFSGLALSSSPEEPLHLEITVRVYDYAGTRAGTLGRAKQVAATILRQAGVETVWTACRTSLADSPKDAACQRPLGPRDLVLRVVNESMARRMGRHYETLGYALHVREGFSTVAAAYHHRAIELERGTIAPRFAILGHMMAHELGHLLLEEEGHSGDGIMRAVWGPEDLQKAAFGRLAFTPRQARWIRQNVEDRMRADQRR